MLKIIQWSCQWPWPRRGSLPHIFSQSCDPTHSHSHIPSANEAKIILSPKVQAQLDFTLERAVTSAEPNNTLVIYQSDVNKIFLKVFEVHFFLLSMQFTEAGFRCSRPIGFVMIHSSYKKKTPEELFLCKNQHQLQQRGCWVN